MGNIHICLRILLMAKERTRELIPLRFLQNRTGELAHTAVCLCLWRDSIRTQLCGRHFKARSLAASARSARAQRGGVDARELRAGAVYVSARGRGGGVILHGTTHYVVHAVHEGGAPTITTNTTVLQIRDCLKFHVFRWFC